MENEELIEDGTEAVNEVVDQSGGISGLIDQGVPFYTDQNNEESSGGSFPAPFQSKFGNSTVDLTQGNNEDTMMEEYREWFHLGRDRKFGIFHYNKPELQDQRNQLKDNWYQKY